MEKAEEPGVCIVVQFIASRSCDETKPRVNLYISAVKNIF